MVEHFRLDTLDNTFLIHHLPSYVSFALFQRKKNILMICTLSFWPLDRYFRFSAQNSKEQGKKGKILKLEKCVYFVYLKWRYIKFIFRSGHLNTLRYRCRVSVCGLSTCRQYRTFSSAPLNNNHLLLIIRAWIEQWQKKNNNTLIEKILSSRTWSQLHYFNGVNANAIGSLGTRHTQIPTHTNKMKKGSMNSS